MSAQKLIPILTNTETDLIEALQTIIDDGNFIRSVIQDVHSKGGHEALYVAICEKKFIPPRKVFKKQETITTIPTTPKTTT